MTWNVNSSPAAYPDQMVSPDSQYLANSVKHQKSIAWLLSRENILLPRAGPKLDCGALT
jgi:hypothetical protein